MDFSVHASSTPLQWLPLLPLKMFHGKGKGYLRRQTPNCTRSARMSEEQWKDKEGGSGDAPYQHYQPSPQYGTFPGTISQPPVMGFPQPIPPPGASGYPLQPGPTHFHHGYQSVPVYAVAEGRPLRGPRLPCCGIGIGWFLFIVGFFLAAIPWYVAAFILLCATRVDHREKPGYVACTIAAVIATIAAIFGATKGADVW